MQIGGSPIKAHWMAKIALVPVVLKIPYWFWDCYPNDNTHSQKFYNMYDVQSKGHEKLYYLFKYVSSA